MAILSGINTRMRGSVGDWTYSRTKGKTVAKQKVEKKATPTRTYAMMCNRTKFHNLLNLYSAFGDKLHPSFQNKEMDSTDNNEFVGRNIVNSSVYLTKSEARQGGCVVAEYMVSNGSLPTIVVSAGSGDVPVTDIALGSLTLGPSTTLKEFSEAVVNNNDAYAYGDQITVFVAKQSVNAGTQVPYVRILAQELTLNKKDTETLLRDVVSAEGFSVVDNKLGMDQPVDGAVAWIHSRKKMGKTLVSSQQFYVTNSILASYQTAAKRDSAIASYGGVKPDAYLTPNIDDYMAED